jgi:hypothetical protein
MKTLSFRTAVALSALMIAGPAAHAELMDVRPYWNMTCFPARNAPYQVEDINGRTLVITSIHGVRHRYAVIDSRFARPGFVITATDGNRVLRARFGPDHGWLSTATDTDRCSSDLAGDMADESE